jgi:hypothetical protein
MVIIILILLQLNRTAAACRLMVKMDYHSFKVTMKMALGYQRNESTTIIKPSFQATGLTAVETSQLGVSI